MLLSKSGPTDICPHPLRAIRPYDRTPIPATRGAKCSATPTGAAFEMLRQIQSGVKLHRKKARSGSTALFRQRVAENPCHALVWRYWLRSGSRVIAQESTNRHGIDENTRPRLLR